MKKYLMIFMTAFMLMMFTTPIFAEGLPDSAYAVPWSSTDKYVIFSSGGQTTAYSIDSGSYLKLDGTLFYSGQVATAWVLNETAGTWSERTLPRTSTESWYGVSEWQYNIPVSNVLYSSYNILNHAGAVVFQSAIFQLPVTPWIVAMQEGIQNLLLGIGVTSGVLLKIGLAVLGLLLAVRSVPRLIRWVAR